MMTTESTSKNFLLLLKKRNKRKGDASCLIPMNNGMWMGTHATPVVSKGDPCDSIDGPKIIVVHTLGSAWHGGRA